MADLTQDKMTIDRNPDVLEIGVSNVKIYKGALVMTVKGVGYAVKGADTLNGIIQGIAEDTVDNSAGSAGDLNITVLRNRLIELVLTGVTVADVGKNVYVSDDQTGTLTPNTNGVLVGKVSRVIDTNVAEVDMSVLGVATGGDVIEESLKVFPINIQDFMQDDGVVLAVAETADTFYKSLNTNVLDILGEVANNETETSIMWVQVKLPNRYIAGQDVKLRLKNQLTGAGTSGASTLDVNAYLKDGEGAVGADLVTTAAITPTKAVWQTSDFVITGTTLSPGDVLNIKITGVVIESATADLQLELDGFAILADVKG